MHFSVSLHFELFCGTGIGLVPEQYCIKESLFSLREHSRKSRGSDLPKEFCCGF